MNVVFELKRYVIGSVPPDSVAFRVAAGLNSAARSLLAILGYQDYFQEQRYWAAAIPKLHPIVSQTHNLRQMFPGFLLPLMTQFKDVKPTMLDIGSGPYSLLGYAADQNIATVYAVDPLAVYYDSVMKHHGYTYPVSPRAGKGEDIAKLFAGHRFEVVYCSNALDHVADPQKTLRMMVELAKPGGLIVVESYVDEGKENQYSSLHQFDLTVENGRLICLAKSGNRIDLGAGLPVTVVHSGIQTSIERGGGLPYFATNDKPWFSIVFLKDETPLVP